jgi:hypothetical protein
MSEVLFWSTNVRRALLQHRRFGMPRVLLCNAHWKLRPDHRFFLQRRATIEIIPTQAAHFRAHPRKEFVVEFDSHRQSRCRQKNKQLKSQLRPERLCRKLYWMSSLCNLGCSRKNAVEFSDDRG